MKYYFFKTEPDATDPRRNRLHALPGQTLEDGTLIDTKLNVQAPKEKDKYPFGNREDYPVGTYFCSDHLEVVYEKSKPYYTVFEDNDVQKAPNFHPVKDSDIFSFARLEHQNVAMDAAFALFMSGIDPNSETQDEGAQPQEQTETLLCSPADGNGRARAASADWKERYADQVEIESDLFVTWMRKLFAGIRLKSRIIMGTSKPVFAELYHCGESIDTLASRMRFEAYLSKEKLQMQDFELLNDSPLKKYLDYLKSEHDRQGACSAIERDPANMIVVSETGELLAEVLAMQTGISSIVADSDLENIKKSLEAGWTLDDMINPENLKKASLLNDYVRDMATGKIPVPKKINAGGLSFVDTLLAEKKNRAPKDQDGFHVEPGTWKLLLRQLYRRANTMLVGPSGSGKTEVIKRLCEQTGTPYTIIQMGSVTDPTVQLVGKMDFKNDPNSTKLDTEFDWAEFAKAIQRPGVVILDEINRIARNGDNLLFGCLDSTRALAADGSKGSDARTIPVHPECCFFATANIGDEFTGTKQIDAALNTRFPIKVEVDYLSVKDEQEILMARTGVTKEQAYNIAFVANRIREMYYRQELQVPVSTRETLACAELVRDGFSELDALTYTFLPIYDKGSGPKDPTSERSAVSKIISQRFNNKK